MDQEKIAELINSALTLDELHVKFDGSQCTIVAVSDDFEQMSRVKRQQVVYAPLTEAINSGDIHAVTIKTYSVAQWQRDKMFNMP